MVLSEIDLPDYKEVASKIKVNEISVDEKEIEDTLNYLQKNRAKFITENRPAETKDFVEIIYQAEGINDGKEVNDKFILSEGGFMKDFENNLIGMRSGQEKEFMAKFPENNPRQDLAGKEVSFKVKMILVQKMELSEINDEFAKQLGNFQTVDELKKKIKENLTREKETRAKEKKRIAIIDGILKKTDISLPAILVEGELDRMLARFKGNVSSMGHTFEEYLTQNLKERTISIKLSTKILKCFSFFS
jgi:trigger factor